MPDFLLELRSEEIPARMQAKAREDLARLFTEQLATAGLTASLETFATPRRLALIARGLPDATKSQSEERRGPRADAPAQALEGFLKSTGLTRDQLEERTDKKGTFLYARIEKPGRPTADVLAQVIPAIVRAFPWPKSMRWGDASASAESPRWVRPLTGIVALLGEHIVPFEVPGITSGAATLGHRFHHPGIITIGSADDYETKLRACHVILRAEDRAQIIREGARSAAAAAGLTLVEDEALVAENAGLTEWPVPLLGRFDPAFLDVPREVIVLTMRTNQKYFACTNADGQLAPAFVCTANIEASDGGAAIVAGNQRVLSARLADAKFFWEADLKMPLEEQARKLGDIVFHEKLGTVADKVERVAKLARWLVDQEIIGEKKSVRVERSRDTPSSEGEILEGLGSARQGLSTSLETNGDVSDLADLTERAARLCKADLVTQMVAEFPELQGTIGAHLARAQGEDPQVADAIRDHYKPVGQGDEVPIAPVTVAVSLADKLDSVSGFFSIGEKPTGSKDPFALRRSALGIVRATLDSVLRYSLKDVLVEARHIRIEQERDQLIEELTQRFLDEREDAVRKAAELRAVQDEKFYHIASLWGEIEKADRQYPISEEQARNLAEIYAAREAQVTYQSVWFVVEEMQAFFADRLKVQQREAGVRHDLIDAVFALGGEDDLVRLLARVRALQAFVETPEGRDLLAGYKRAANILKKEGHSPVIPAKAGTQDSGPSRIGDERRDAGVLAPGLRRDDEATNEKHLSYTPDPMEYSLIAALGSAEPRARAAIEAEDFEAAMAALASLRGPVDSFFDKVIVNDPDPTKRAARLDLLVRMRDAFHCVADFSRIEG